MAHNLEYSKRTNSYSFFSAKLPAWHKLGTVVKDALTSEEAIIAANMDFEVALKPQYMYFDDGEKVLNSTSKCIYRTDTRKPLGTVGNRYTPIQNKEAFAFIDSIVGEGEAVFETAGVLYGGQQTFITAKLPDYISINGDKIDKYLLIVLDHAGKGSMYVMFTPIRVVCWNTLRMALRGQDTKVSIRHTKNYSDRMEEAKRILGIKNEVFALMEEDMNNMTQMIYTPDDVNKLIQLTFLSRAEMKALAKKGTNKLKGGISTRKYNQIQTFWNYTLNGPGQEHSNCIKDYSSQIVTAYGLFNGYTGYLGNVKKHKKEETRFKNTMDNLEIEVFSNLVKDVNIVRSKFDLITR